MLTGLETKKTSSLAAGDAAMRPQAPVNVVDGNGSAVIVGRAEAVATIPSRTREAGAVTPAGASPNSIDVAITGVYPSTTDGPPNRAVVSDMKRAMARLASSTTLNFASRGSLTQSQPHD